MHQEFIKAHQPHPHLYSVGNIVFGKQAVQSEAAQGRVDKLLYPFTGPLKIMRKLDGASFKIEHCLTKRIDKNIPLRFPRTRLRSSHLSQLTVLTTNLDN